jgi:hypothetical protein
MGAVTGYALTSDTIENIRTLRYEHGLTRPEIRDRVGVSIESIRKYAPGQFVGKVENAPVRKVFLASGLSASEVATALGWFSPKRPDSSRVLRTLGLRLEQHSAGRKAYRQMIDAEVAMNIAEACGVAGWSVLPEDES